MSKDLSIEYAHIYSNNKIGEEHKLSLDILGSLRDEEKAKGHSISLVVLVDDYSFPDPAFDYATFSAWLSENGFKPDLVLRESQLIPLCDETLKLVNDPKLKDQIGDYVRQKKYPCSLFVATWYLLRLGYLSSPIFNAELAAKNVINILPLSFKPFEEKALEIIAATKYVDAVKKIDWRYFEGRLVV